MGSSAALCLPPLAVRDARDFGVTRSHSQAWRIGRAIALCRQMKCVFFCLFSEICLNVPLVPLVIWMGYRTRF